MSGRWALPPLAAGEFAPPFVAASRNNPNFHFNTVAGRYLLLAFMPRDAAARAAASAALDAYSGRLDDRTLAAFLVAPDAEVFAATADRTPGLRWFLDADGAVRRLYGALEQPCPEHPAWFLLDPALRIIATAPLSQPDAIFAAMAELPPLAEHAGVPLVAPVLIAPRILEPELCRRLIAYYEERGGAPSGVMRDQDGRTVGVLDPMKSRRDVYVEPPELHQALRSRIRRRLLPEIRKAFQFHATHIERYLVACYNAGEAGRFAPHRDNETLGTAHRRFAVSINLNGEFEGGDLRFPEFGPRTYRPPPGGAVVFCCSLQHEATPVTRGRRYAFLPFLYDEPAAAIRQDNQAFLATQ